MGQYDVTKAGIISMTKTLAFEEAKHGVRVNAVCPGLTLTPFHRKRYAAAGRTQADIDSGGAGWLPAAALGGPAGGGLSDPLARLGRSLIRHGLGADGRWRALCEVRSGCHAGKRIRRELTPGI